MSAVSDETAPRASSLATTFLARLARLFRFRLLTLFIGMSLIAGWLAWTFHREPISALNVRKLQQLREIPLPDVYKLVYSPDRRRVAFISWDKPVEIREAVTFWPVRSLGEKLIAFAFSPDQRRVAFSTNSNRAEIQNLDGSQHVVLETECQQPHVQFSPDGRLLATGGYGSEAKLWDATTGRLIHSLNCGTIEGGLTPVFSPDGQTIAVGNRNSNTVFFVVSSGQKVMSLPERVTQELAYSPSGHILAVAYVDGSIRLWESLSGKLIAEQHKAAEEIYSLDWSPDGKMLASSGRKGDIGIWDDQLQLLHTLPAPEWVISVKFSPDGTRLITAGGSGAPGTPRSVTVWGIRPSVLGIWGR
jgi:WD40 repeat protein